METASVFSMNLSGPAKLIPRSRAAMMFLSLVFASAACLLMVAVRFFYSGQLKFTFLIWNLLLAWIPLIFSLAAYRLYARHAPAGWSLTVCAALWFIFFPNAPYIVTDFVHLRQTPLAPLWYDLLIIMSFAWTGLFIGYLSLYLMQEIARGRFGARASWCFTIIMLALSSFGIYLGRFSRWNSWDILRNPAGLLWDSLHSINFFSRPGPLVFTATLFLFLLLSYCALFSLTHLHEREAGR
jgi:uncharacterized membrane protein